MGFDSPHDDFQGWNIHLASEETTEQNMWEWQWITTWRRIQIVRPSTQKTKKPVCSWEIFLSQGVTASQRSTLRGWTKIDTELRGLERAHIRCLHNIQGQDGDVQPFLPLLILYHFLQRYKWRPNPGFYYLGDDTFMSLNVTMVTIRLSLLPPPPHHSCSLLFPQFFLFILIALILFLSSVLLSVLLCSIYKSLLLSLPFRPIALRHWSQTAFFPTFYFLLHLSFHAVCVYFLECLAWLLPLS